MSITFIETFLLFFANGITLEFGDELICIFYENVGFDSQGQCREYFRLKIEAGATTHTYIAIAGGVLGYAFTPTFFLYIAIKGKPQTAGQIFKTILTVEFFEGSVSVLGQLATDGVFSTAILSLVLSVAVGFIRGSVLAFAHQWSRSDSFKFLVSLIACVAIATALQIFGVVDLSKFLATFDRQESIKAVESPPAPAQPKQAPKKPVITEVENTSKTFRQIRPIMKETIFKFDGVNELYQTDRRAVDKYLDYISDVLAKNIDAGMQGDELRALWLRTQGQKATAAISSLPDRLIEVYVDNEISLSQHFNKIDRRLCPGTKHMFERFGHEFRLNKDIKWHQETMLFAIMAIGNANTYKGNYPYSRNKGRFDYIMSRIVDKLSAIHGDQVVSYLSNPTKQRSDDGYIKYCEIEMDFYREVKKLDSTTRGHFMREMLRN